MGLNLALHYHRSEDECERLAAALRAQYPALDVTTHRADMGLPDEIRRLVGEVEARHAKQILVLIANAGMGRKIPHINNITLDDFTSMLSVNLTAPFLLTKLVVPGMQAAQFGRVVTVSSISALGAGVNGCHYSAAKGGLQGMVRNLATRLGRDGITVNDVAPAMIGNTGMIPGEAAIPGVRETVPVGRLGTPREVANAVAMFVGNGYVTGQSLVVAGGLPHL